MSNELSNRLTRETESKPASLIPRGSVSDAASPWAPAAFAARGSSAIRQIGQSPRAGDVTSGCIGQAKLAPLATGSAARWRLATKAATTAAPARVASRPQANTIIDDDT